MRNFKQCLLITLLVFIATLAFLEVDRRCSDMYGTGGKIAGSVANAVNLVSTANRTSPQSGE